MQSDRKKAFRHLGVHKRLLEPLIGGDWQNYQFAWEKFRIGKEHGQEMSISEERRHDVRCTLNSQTGSMFFTIRQGIKMGIVQGTRPFRAHQSSAVLAAPLAVFGPAVALEWALQAVIVYHYLGIATKTR